MKSFALTPLLFFACISCTGETSILQTSSIGNQPASAVLRFTPAGPSTLSPYSLPATDTVLRISGYVSDVFKDRKGALWFSTHFNGVCRFNGTSARWYTTKQGLAGNVVRAVEEDSNGMIWLATNQGLSCFNGTGFKTYSEDEGLPRHEVFCLFSDSRGILWVGTENGVSRFNGTAFESFPLPEAVIKDLYNVYPAPKLVNCIYEDRAGNMWFGTNGNGVYCLMNNTDFNGVDDLIHYSEASGMCDNFVQDIHEDRQGNIWFSTRFGGVSMLKAYSPLITSSRFTHFGKEQGLNGLFIRSVFEDAQGAVWFATAGDGVYRYDGKALTHFTKKDGLADDYVQRITIDGDGVMWFATGMGVSKYTGTSAQAGQPLFITLPPLNDGC